MTERAVSLSEKQRITCAYLHYVRDVSQHDIAVAMGGVNAGRVAEACTAILLAAKDPVGSRRKLEKAEAELLAVLKREAASAKRCDDKLDALEADLYAAHSARRRGL